MHFTLSTLYTEYIDVNSRIFLNNFFIKLKFLIKRYLDVNILLICKLIQEYA